MCANDSFRVWNLCGEEGRFGSTKQTKNITAMSRAHSPHRATFAPLSEHTNNTWPSKGEIQIEIVGTTKRKIESAKDKHTKSRAREMWHHSEAVTFSTAAHKTM